MSKCLLIFPKLSLLSLSSLIVLVSSYEITLHLTYQPWLSSRLLVDTIIEILSSEKFIFLYRAAHVYLLNFRPTCIHPFPTAKMLLAWLLMSACAGKAAPARQVSVFLSSTSKHDVSSLAVTIALNNIINLF